MPRRDALRPRHLPASAAARTLAVVLLALVAALSCGKTAGGGALEPASWALCEKNSECTLAAKTCCGTCGKATLRDVDGVNEERLDEQRADVCPKPVPCPGCPSEANPDLLATCDDGTCVPVSVRENAASACAADADCRLRVTGCCECGGSTEPWNLIAVARDGEALYESLVCDPEHVCPGCEPIYPTGVEAYCADDGHCAVRTGEPSVCSLPFEAGPCDAAFPVYAFVDGACVARVYGGCGGNENRFDSIERCMATCEGRPDPNGCPEGREDAEVCVACGLVGGCGERARICAKTCASSEDCDAPLGFCGAGRCAVGGCD